jgi:hypothetical protein
MALVSLDSLIVPFPNLATSSFNATMIIDANGEKAGWVMQAPKTGTIDRVGFLTVTVTTGDTVDVRVETVDASGLPTGTLFGTNTNNSQVIAAADDNTWFEVTLTAGASVTRGDFFAVVVSLPGSGATGNMQIARYSPVISITPPYCLLYTSSWAKGSFSPVGSVRYSDATYPPIPGLVSVTALAANNVNTGTTPDERGVKFVPNCGCKVSGIWFATSSASDSVVKLYDSTDTLLASKAYDGDVAQATNPRMVTLDTEVTLTAGATYRATVLPSSATNVQLWRLTHRSDAAAQMPGNDWAFQETTRTDAGAWTDTANARTQMGLVLSAVEDGASSGSPSARSFAT